MRVGAAAATVSAPKPAPVGSGIRVADSVCLDTGNLWPSDPGGCKGMSDPSPARERTSLEKNFRKSIDIPQQANRNPCFSSSSVCSQSWGLLGVTWHLHSETLAGSRPVRGSVFAWKVRSVKKVTPTLSSHNGYMQYRYAGMPNFRPF